MSDTSQFDDLVEINPDALLADGFETAYIGFVSSPFNDAAVAVYDRDKCLEILQARDGMEDTEAEEFFSFNVEGAYVGKFTPLFLQRPRT